MKTIEVLGHVDEKHRLSAEVPQGIPPGPIRVKLEFPSDSREDQAGNVWEQGVAREWAEEWADPREDIYTLEDGEPIDGTR